MLHIRPDQATVTAAWSADGWPALISPVAQPGGPPLYWLLQELPAAAAAADWDVVDDMLDEAAVWLDRIWLTPPAPPAPAGKAIAVAANLWGEMQRGRGAEDTQHIAFHAGLLQKLLGTPGHRGPPAIPVYVPPNRRISTGRLPLRTAAAGQPQQAPPVVAEQVLLQLLAVLSNPGGGHLSDRVAHRCPPGAAPHRTGWTRTSRRPTGPLLGSIDTETDSLLLRPAQCLTVVAAPTAWTTDVIGDALAAAWLVDTTLDTAAATRRALVDASVIDHQDPEPAWRLSLNVFDRGQFFDATPLRLRAPR